MLDGKRFLYVGFMCHQSIEKILKAYYCLYKKKSPPYIHNLTILAKKSKLYNSFLEAKTPIQLESIANETKWPNMWIKLLAS